MEKDNHESDILYENEIKSNRGNTLVLIISSMLLVITYYRTEYTWFDDTYSRYFVIATAALYALCALVCILQEYKGAWLKVLIMCCFYIGLFVVGMHLSAITFMVLIIPVIMSCGYFRLRFTCIIAAISAAFFIAAPFAKTFVIPFFFNYIDVRFLLVQEGTNITFNDGWLFYPFMEMGIDKLEYLKNELQWEFIPGFAVYSVVAAVCLAVTAKGRRMIDTIAEDERRKADLQAALNESHNQLLISQIQPHFVFNTLNTIYELCDDDPRQAQDAIDSFAAYLRMNVDSIDSDRTIPFGKELKHIKTYVELEQLRFGEKLKVEYDIGTDSFFVPPISIQPLVENAIKHGVCRKKGGGTVWLSTYDSEDSTVITVSDDGHGFEPREDGNYGEGHAGLKNVRERLRIICNAEMKIESSIGEGTKITIIIPKEQKDENTRA